MILILFPTIRVDKHPLPNRPDDDDLLGVGTQEPKFSTDCASMGNGVPSGTVVGIVSISGGKKGTLEWVNTSINQCEHSQKTLLIWAI